MECSSLDQIFNQIIESERIVEKERMLLIQVRSDIEQCEKLIKNKKEANLCLDEKISNLCQKLCEEKVNIYCLQNKEETLSKRIKTLEQRRDAYLKEEESTKELLKLNRVAFCNEVDVFMTSIGLPLFQPDHSVYNLDMELMNLKKEEEQLTKAINDFNQSQVDAHDFQQKKQDIGLELKEQEKQLKEIKDIIQHNECQLQFVKEEMEKVNHVPNTDHEFKNVREKIIFYQQEIAENEKKKLIFNECKDGRRNRNKIG